MNLLSNDQTPDEDVYVTPKRRVKSGIKSHTIDLYYGVQMFTY